MPKPEPTSPELWQLAICAMQDQGIGEASARAFLGLCLKSWPEQTVREAVVASLGKVNFKAYCKAVLSSKPPRKLPPPAQSELDARPVDPVQARESYQAHRDQIMGMLKRDASGG